MSWVLSIGGIDQTALLAPGAQFTEVASSASGWAFLALTGAPELAVGDSIVLADENGVAAWEGSISTLSQQRDELGAVRFTQIAAVSLAAATSMGIRAGTSGNQDGSDVARMIANALGMSWTGPANWGIAVGSMSFTKGDAALSLLALLLGTMWRIENGVIVFADTSAIRPLDTTFNATPAILSAIAVKGGADDTSRQPLETIAFNSEQGYATGYAAFPEIADLPTLLIAAAQLASRYEIDNATASVSMAVSPPLRAGDWVVDNAGTTLPINQITYVQVAGNWMATCNLGYPPLPPIPQYDPAFTDAMSRFPAARIHTDYVATGLDASASGDVVTVADGTVNIGGSVHTLTQTALTFPSDGVYYIVATSASAILAQPIAVSPIPGFSVALYRVTVDNGLIVELADVRSHGGIGTYNLKSATPGTPSVALAGSIGFTSEGGANAMATVPFTVSGVTLDDTIRSIDITWSLAGQNEWHPPISVSWAPNNPNATAYIHGLAAGQAYDLGIVIRGHDGNSMTAQPMLLGSSPTISATDIAIALNLDQVSDGVTYGRTKQTALTSGQPDLAKAGVINKHLGNIADDATSQRYAVLQIDDSRRAIIDFSQTSHLNKHLGAIPDSTDASRYAVSSIDGNRRALIDYAQAHIGQFPNSSPFQNQQSMVPAAATFAIDCQGQFPSGGNRQISYTWPAWSWKTSSGASGSGSTFSAITAVDYLNTPIASGSYYVTAAYNWGTAGNVTTFFSNGPIALSAATSFLGDGKMTLVVNQGPITVPATTGNGSIFTPPPPQCPSVHQLIETRDRGIIPAGQVVPGDFVRGFGMSWVRVTRNEIGKKMIVRVVIDNRAYDVDADHTFLTPIGWWPAQYLNIGDPIVNFDTRRPLLIVKSIHLLGVGEYAKIEVEGSLLRLSTDDPAVSHNITYQTY